MPIEFRRSPQLAPGYRPRRIPLPAPPARPARERFPALAMAAPLVVGLAMLVAAPSPLTVAFVAVSPLMALGGWLEQRVRARRRTRAAQAAFAAELEAASQRIRAAHEEERSARLLDDPSTEAITGRMLRRAPELWARRPGEEGFLRVRLGLGRRPSRTTVVVPPRAEGAEAAWARLEATAADAAELDGVPVTVPLGEVGALGIAGTGAEAVMRALLLQLAGSHAPGELRIVAFVADEAADEWAWLARLPHLASGAETAAFAASTATRRRLLAALDTEPEGQDAPGTAATTLIAVLGEVPERAELVTRAVGRPGMPSASLWLAQDPTGLPAHCRAFLDIGPPAILGRTVERERILLTELERCSRARAAAASERIADLVDADTPEAAAGIATSVPFARIEPGLAEGGVPAVLARWRAGDRQPSLDAAIGLDHEGVRYIDLRADGPHALVGGTTGSGKSELLQTWICSLALRHAPRRLTFLLIDYKGGAAFSACAALPHTVGMVTDLTPRLARRALVSLRAEVLRRERWLAEAAAKDLVALERSGRPAPPALVIVVDEFAALAAEHPDFIEGLVDIAQRGRSLGLHLVMATQRPAGVIRDSLRANTTLRIALRLAEPMDSVDVIGEPVAAGLTAATPGRGFVRIGPGRPAPFQTAWLDEASAAALVATIAAAARQEGEDPPRRPWLPELPACVGLEELPRDGPGLAIGLADHPDRQSQEALAFDPDSDGHLLVIGRGGSGRSTALRSLAMAATAAMLGAAAAGRSGSTSAAEGDPCWIYAIDAGGALSGLAGLPTVGAVVPLRDEERVRRVALLLGEELDRRLDRTGRVPSTPGMPGLPGTPDPRILLLVDGLGALREGREHRLDDPVLPVLIRVLQLGRAARMHVVASAEGGPALPSALLGAFGLRIVLRLGSPTEAAMLGLGTVPEDWPPGRGLARDAETQLARPGADPAAEALGIRRLARRLARAGIAPAPGVPVLGERIPLARLPPTIAGRPALGVTTADLRAIGFPTRGILLVAGGIRSGRSTALRTVLASLRRSGCGDPPIVLGPDRPVPPATAPRLLVVERAHEFAALPEEAGVAALLRDVRRGGGLAIVECDPALLAAAWQLQAELRAAAAGLFLRAEEQDALALLRVPLGRSPRSAPPGRGWFVEQGSAVELQVAIDEGAIGGDAGDRDPTGGAGRGPAGRKPAGERPVHPGASDA